MVLNTRRFVEAADHIKISENNVIQQGTLGVLGECENETYVFFPTAHRLFNYKEVKPASPITFEEALDVMRQYRGHYAKEGQFQFNIKIHNYTLPTIVNDWHNDEIKYEHLNDILNHELYSFMGDKYSDGGLNQQLDNTFNKWWTAGKGGGYLIIEFHDKYDADFFLAHTEEEDGMNLSYEMTLDEIEGYKQMAIGLAYTLMYINESVECSKHSIPDWINSEEAWENVIELINEEVENEIKERDLVKV